MINIPILKRTTLLVKDIERSLELYRDVLGFSVHYIQDSTPDSYSYPVFKIPKHCSIRFATLDGENQERVLGLTEVKGIELPTPSMPIMSSLVIKVQDINITISDLENLGIVCTDIKKDEGQGFWFYETSFQDLDGHLIVVYEIGK